MRRTYLDLIDQARELLRARPRREYSFADLDALLPKHVAHPWHVAAELVRRGHAVRLVRGAYWFTDGDPDSTPDELTPYWCASLVMRSRAWCFSFDTALALRQLRTHGSVIRLNASAPLNPAPFMAGYELAAACERRLNMQEVPMLRTAAGAFPVATAERAIVDALALPRHVGGMLEAIRLLTRHQQDIDPARLCHVASRLGWPSTTRRVGFVLDRLGLGGEHLRRLHDGLSRSYVNLDPAGPPTGPQTRRWRLRLNVSPDALDAALTANR